jgi:beta-carotene hydroxylase
METAANTSLRAQEMAIAERFMGGTPWLMIGWGVANTIAFFAPWPLTLLHIIPLWVAFPLAIACVTRSYLPSHDTHHNIIVPAASRWHWLNEFFGHIVIFPLGLPFHTASATHLEHHRHTNDPLRDPDYPTHAENAWDALRQSLPNRQPNGAGGRRYMEALSALGTPAAKTALVDALLMTWAISPCSLPSPGAAMRSKRRCSGGCPARSPSPTSISI